MLLLAIHATAANGEAEDAEYGGEPQSCPEGQQAVAGLGEGGIGARCARSLGGVVLGGRDVVCIAFIRSGRRAAALGVARAGVAALRAVARAAGVVACGALRLAHDGIGREMPGGDIEIAVVHPTGDRLHLPIFADSVGADSVRIEGRQVAINLQAYREDAFVLLSQLIVPVECGAVAAQEADVDEDGLLSLRGVDHLRKSRTLVGGKRRG